MIVRFLLLVLLISACEQSNETIIRISKENLLHDNSSKIWVINKVTKKGVNYGKQKLTQKDVAIFYKSEKVYFQPLSTLGNFPDRYGKFFLSSDNQSLFIDFGDEKWNFKIQQMNSETIVLKPLKKSDFLFELELINYPER